MQKHQPKPTPQPRQIYTAPRPLPRPSLQPAPKPGQGQGQGKGNDLTIEEKAALWDEATALHAQARADLAEIDKLRFRAQTAEGKIRALFARARAGGGGNPIEVCELCQLRHEGPCNA